MIEVKTSREYINVFDNISDTLKYLKRPKKDGRNSASSRNDMDFCGTHNYQEAVDLFMYGDEELLKKIKDESKKLKIDKLLGNCLNRQVYEQRVYGCIPNVPAYLMGNPINMINPEKNRISHKIVNIFLNISCNGGTSREKITRIGTLYLNVIDFLEKKGYRCNLYVGDVSRVSDEKQFFMVRIKTDREPLNMKKMAFPLAHPSMLRRINFRWNEVHDGTDFTHDGYGQPFQETKIIKKILSRNLKEDFIIFNYASGNQDIKSVLDNLKKQGIDLEI